MLIFPVQELQSIEIRKKFGVPDTYGVCEYGKLEYGHGYSNWGVYRVWRRWGHRQNFREKFYQPSVQNQPNKILSQQKFAAAVLSWQGLTIGQKILWRKLSYGRHMSGYNFYLRNYLKT